VQKLAQKRMEGDLEGDPAFFFRPLSCLIRLFLADASSIMLESRLLTFGLRNILISEHPNIAVLLSVVSARYFRVVGIINETVIGCIRLVLERAKLWPPHSCT